MNGFNLKNMSIKYLIVVSISALNEISLKMTITVEGGVSN